MNNKSSK